MNVYWFTLGDFSLRAYGTVLVLAFFLSMGVAVFLARSAGRKDLTIPIVDMSLFAIFGGLIGARLWHVFVFNWDYFSNNPWEIVKVWHGGLAIQGGLVGGLAVAAFYCYRKKINFWHMADICAPAIILGQSIGRNANLLNGDGLGSPTGGDFGILYPPGTNAYATYGTQPLWPAEIWEGQIDIIIFAVLLILRLRIWPSGYIFLFYTLMYSANRFGLEFLRGDTPLLLGISAAQWSALIFAVIALVFLILRRKAPAGLGIEVQKNEGSDGKNDLGEKSGIGKKNNKGKENSGRKGNSKKMAGQKAGNDGRSHLLPAEDDALKHIAQEETQEDFAVDSEEDPPSIVNKNVWEIVVEDKVQNEKDTQNDWEIIVEDTHKNKSNPINVDENSDVKDMGDAISIDEAITMDEAVLNDPSNDYSTEKDSDQSSTDKSSDTIIDSPMPIEIPPHIDIPVLKDSFKDDINEDDHS